MSDTKVSNQSVISQDVAFTTDEIIHFVDESTQGNNVTDMVNSSSSAAESGIFLDTTIGDIVQNNSSNITSQEDIINSTTLIETQQSDRTTTTEKNLVTTSSVSTNIFSNFTLVYFLVLMALTLKF